MDRKEMWIAVICVALASLAVTCVTASPWTSNTPLYTFRMEQASSEKNFLPTPVRGFIYATEKGCDLGYDVLGCCDAAKPLYTCLNTACGFTCEGSCAKTCDTVLYGPTCVLDTCLGPTCDTCEPYCQ